MRLEKGRFEGRDVQFHTGPEVQEKVCPTSSEEGGAPARTTVRIAGSR